MDNKPIEACRAECGPCAGKGYTAGLVECATCRGYGYVLLMGDNFTKANPMFTMQITPIGEPLPVSARERSLERALQRLLAAYDDTGGIPTPLLDVAREALSQRTD